MEGDSVMARILVVEDNRLGEESLSHCLDRQTFTIKTVCDNRAALEALRRGGCDLMLLANHPPRIDAMALLEQLKNDAGQRHLPVIVVSSRDDMEHAVRCIEMGADDYLLRPFDRLLLKARIKASLARKFYQDQENLRRELMERYNFQLKEQVREQLMEIISAHHASILAMSKLAESKDSETGAHLERMREYCRVISYKLMNVPRFRQRIDDNFIENIYAASPLHDIGKVGIPDSILLKPAKLDGQEWRIMCQHPVIGAETLRQVVKQHPGNAFLEMGIEIAEYHHEKWDGSGYPHGLSGERIPLAARILALGDVYDALTSRRCYKKAFSHEDSRRLIVEGAGSHFDPAIVAAFLESEDEFIRIRNEFHDEEDEQRLCMMQAG